MAAATAERDGDGEQKRGKQGRYRTLPFIMGEYSVFVELASHHQQFNIAHLLDSWTLNILDAGFLTVRHITGLSVAANEICDRFATAGFNANLISYLTQQLNMTLVGMLGLVFSAVVPPPRPLPCPPSSSPGTSTCRRASGGQLAVLYLSMLCTCLGTGGIRPSVVAFGADQFDDQQGAEAWVNRNRRYFNVYFFTMGSAALLALTLVVYIQDNVGWGWGFGILAISMFVSIVVFVAAYPLYVRAKPGGSPFTRLVQVLVAAFKKRNAAVQEDTGMLYQDKELDALISTKGRLLHTNKLRFLDRAAIVTPGDVSDSGQPKPCRLSTVHRVEELKSIARLLPI
ncbi:Protein NRT1/ PTR FAMILY 3.1 [Dichanthelium oligosanthes]|uniref:Protein NRT1/ PTR FAMILY 3.1 n=1 Tax=Dichanthelium oligosanthes TaxID=888268 RepID=A0A1E5VMH6_9POAL|nr:Protein NRT1/ PTR FAMILY 3.1 [Dichanthelium oligosanthes]